VYQDDLPTRGGRDAAFGGDGTGGAGSNPSDVGGTTSGSVTSGGKGANGPAVGGSGSTGGSSGGMEPPVAGASAGGQPDGSGGDGGDEAGAPGASGGVSGKDGGGAGGKGGTSETGGAGAQGAAGTGTSGTAGAGGKGTGGNGSAGAGGTSAGGGGAAGSGGAGGAGGTTAAPRCADHPLTARSSWVPSASHDNSGTSPATNLIDNATSRWTTGKAQSGGEWLLIDFSQLVNLSYVNLQQSEQFSNDYPRQFAVRVSETAPDPNAPTSPVLVSGSGTNGVASVFSLPTVTTGRFLLIKQLGTSLSWWSAVEIEVSCVD
jgi:hypothetical protein